jgi:6-phospho-beta-glucosidase
VKLTILGGSSPFTLALFIQAAKCKANPLWRFESIVLYGRNESVLQHLTALGNSLCFSDSPRISYELDLPYALLGTQIVIIQMRFGDLELRKNIELLCKSENQFADETLGPGGLCNALVNCSNWLQLGLAIKKYSPDALVLNLINPLSLSSYQIASVGLNVVGLCEGPLDTVQSIATLLNCQLSDLTWKYTGLNHRGLVHSIQLCEEPLLRKHFTANCQNSIARFYRPDLEAFVSKELFIGLDRRHWAYGRASIVQNARDYLIGVIDDYDRILNEEILSFRPSPWYSMAVLPFISAWTGQSCSWKATTSSFNGNMFTESRCIVDKELLTIIDDPAPHGEAAIFVEQLKEHERACIDAIKSPTLSAVKSALALDPTVSDINLHNTAQTVFRMYESQYERGQFQ